MENIDKVLLENIMREKNVSHSELANALKINNSTLYRKINGKSDFYRDEINATCIYLGINNPKPIFFKQLIADTQLKLTEQSQGST